MKRCKIIGLTGQTGAGKSTALRIFEQKGAAVFDSDAAVKNIYEGGSPCLRAVAAQFGGDIINPDGTLDRALLAKRAFSSKQSTEALNRTVHPFVTAELLKKIKRERPRCLVCDAPQLFESNIDVLCDVIVCVTADESIRKQRIMERDGISPDQAAQRLNAQYGEDFYKKNSDYILINNGDAESFEKSVRSLADEIIR